MSDLHGNDGGYPNYYPYDPEWGINLGPDEEAFLDGDEDLHDYHEEAYNRQLMDDPDA